MPHAQKLEAIEKRLKAATPGKWSVNKCSYAEDDSACGIDPMGRFDCSHDECHHPLDLKNAEFIAHAPEDIAWLLERIKRLESGLKRIGDAEWTYQNGATAAGEFQAIANVTLEDCA